MKKTILTIFVFVLILLFICSCGKNKGKTISVRQKAAKAYSRAGPASRRNPNPPLKKARMPWEDYSDENPMEEAGIALSRLNISPIITGITVLKIII